MRTQVGIVGAGPAGLALSHMLRRDDIDSVIIENQSRDHVERRVRAGVLEQASVELLESIGAGARMRREGMLHHGISLRFDGEDHRVDFTRLAGRYIMVYGQQEIVKDLISANLDGGGSIHFETTGARVGGIESDAPYLEFRHNGEDNRLDCDFIAGCDGFHGVCRAAVRAGVLQCAEHEFPFSWLGILAEAAPSSGELIYAAHDRGFALHSMRSPGLVRNYLQCDNGEDPGNWPDERIWEELQQRMALNGSFSLNTGPIVEKTVAPVRGFVAEPMQHGRLFLAGDAAHIVPPTGAKGLNLALKDVQVLAGALGCYYRGDGGAGLGAYTRSCLQHVWRAQHFSWWMTAMLHRYPDEDAYRRGIRLAQLRNLSASAAAATSLAENYTGYSPA